MIEPHRAPVRPRVFSPVNGEAMLLEEEVLPFLDAKRPTAIQLAGPAGAGKTTALRHLAAVLPSWPFVSFLDDARMAEVVAALGRGGVVFAAKHADMTPVDKEVPLQVLTLVPWTDDELLEYLLAVHKERCASVMARLRASANRQWLRGNPEIWRGVLDRLAGDELMTDIRVALRRQVYEHLADRDVAHLAASCCQDALLESGNIPPKQLKQLFDRGCSEPGLRLLRHDPVRVLLAAGQLATYLSANVAASVLSSRLPRELVQETAQLIRADDAALGCLRQVLERGNAKLQPMAASLLHATETGWIPEPGQRITLTGACLEKANWPEVDLRGVNLREADLRDANLAGAILDAADARKACLRSACLRGATMGTLTMFAAADLSNADLSQVKGEKVSFEQANLTGASLEEAELPGVWLTGANLTGARFINSRLSRAKLGGAEIQDADFSGADLERAELSGLKLANARFAGARFWRANLRKCDLEYLDLPGADFEEADLHGAYLTGANMPGANFRKADLGEAGLAEVDWENADLREADLRGASFHLGSTRSGLVGSPIASEGSRTGFYTDDYNEQDFKSPEEIRKANLCGVDLLGARIGGVDFYLVDLRGASYDAQQEEHLRRCGAILEAHV